MTRSSTKKDFSRLRSLRENNQKNNTIKDQELIYEEVTNEEYNTLQKQVLLYDDFVVDDNGEYTGLQDWDQQQSQSESENDVEVKKKIRKVDFVQKMKKRTRELPEQTENEKDFLKSILQDIENEPTEKKVKKEHIKQKPQKKTYIKIEPLDLDLQAPTIHLSRDQNQDQVDPLEIKTDFEDDHFEFDPVAEPVEIKKEIKEIQSIKANDSTKQFLPIFKSSQPAPIREMKIELKPDEPTPDINVDLSADVYMYWLDAFEKNGKVYLFGKISSSGVSKSCCVTISNINRNLYVLPREYHLSDPEKPVTMADVYTEFETLRKKYGIQEYMSKSVVRKYAFEKQDVPQESEYLKVVYPFTESTFPNVSGDSFSHIFGRETNILELFLLKRKIMGPCWLKIKNASLEERNISWCKYELSVKDLKSIEVSQGDERGIKTPPGLVVMSLNLRTIMDLKKSVNEIVCASALVLRNGKIYLIVNIEGDTIDKSGSSCTFIRKVKEIPWPIGFQEESMSGERKLMIQSTEKALLTSLIAYIYRHDPDVIVGHNFVDFDLDVILQRLKFHNVENWSRLGRLKRTKWPQMQKGAGGANDSTHSEKQIVSGRVLCDTFRAAKDYLNSKTNSLTYLSLKQLKIQRDDIQYDKIESFFWDKELLMEMIKHAEYDVYLVLELMFKIQVIPMTKNLTNLAGNLWAKTMLGARAERNEYLLLHEFHQLKYICPDKQPFSIQNEDGMTQKKGRKKPAYAGGLVLEPKAGLYDKYVLLLDFNSLYPSIIQEYNICFTTVDRSGDDDLMPELPERVAGGQLGVLPKLLKGLVERRRQVKALMKNCGDQEYAGYDVRQKALKLTANSMYGCLGFVHSRFFAKPLAMLITSQGRDILQNTVLIAEKENLEVIYGDTDSIMINTNSQSIDEVKKIAVQLKEKVNECYKVLEIEMDGMFKRLLLLKKKKYAAIVVTEKNGIFTEVVETKGLDMVRRDWCDLSHNVSQEVLTNIFSSDSREDSVDKIHLLLEKIKEEVLAGKVSLDLYVINKGLTKNPKDYADKESQPHVQVALKMIQSGLTAKTGDTIPYVICKGESKTMAQRAHHKDDFAKDPTLQVDYDWYLSNQIHPVIARLCHPIEGTDTARIAQSLGLDIKKYHSMTSINEEQLFTLDSNLSIEEKFKNVEKFTPKCTQCQTEKSLDKIIDLETSKSVFECDCGKIFNMKYLENVLTLTIQKLLQKYLDQSVVCDDLGCRERTRNVGVYGRKCLKTHCKGVVSLEFSDKDLYNQLRYYEYLFDSSRVATLYPGREVVLGIFEVYYQGLGEVVKRYLDSSSRHWVELDKLFEFC